MRQRIVCILLLAFLGCVLLGSSSCNRYGCPAEIQQTKVKKKKKLSKGAKTNLFPENMRKNSKQIN